MHVDDPQGLTTVDRSIRACIHARCACACAQGGLGLKKAPGWWAEHCGAIDAATQEAMWYEAAANKRNSCIDASKKLAVKHAPKTRLSALSSFLVSGVMNVRLFEGEMVCVAPGEGHALWTGPCGRKVPCSLLVSAGNCTVSVSVCSILAIFL